jgi:PAS domain-containing protein
MDPATAALIGTIIAALIAPTWLAWWNTRQTAKEFKPNGGSSIKDSLNRLETSVTATQQTSLTLATVLGVAHFETDEQGDFTFVSRDWQRMAHTIFEDALGRGWLLGIADEDRGRIDKDWYECVAHGRPFRGRFTMLSGAIVFCTASPIKNSDKKIVKYVGFCEIEDSEHLKHQGAGYVKRSIERIDFGG